MLSILKKATQSGMNHIQNLRQYVRTDFFRSISTMQRILILN